MPSLPRSHNIVSRWVPSAGATGFRLVDRVRSNHGTLTNMDPATDWVVSGGKGALDFDGSNDYVTSIGSVGSFAFVQNTMRFSLSFWMKLAATGTRYAIAGNTNTSSEKGLFLLFENGAGAGTRAIRLFVTRGVAASPVAEFRSADNAINDTEWHHVAVTAAGDGNSGRIFVDGKQLSTTVATNLNALSTGDSTRTMTIAALPPSFILPFGGQLDDFIIFNTALTASEVREIYRLGRGYGVFPELDFDEGFAAAFKAYWARKQSQLIGGGV
jgi:hypothetical protein